jgi:YEATS domain-containing protein 4
MEGDDTQKLSKGFVVGTLAFWLGKRAEDNKSHEWTVHVRSANGDEDAGLWIKRVVFQLHPTLQPPTRGAPQPLPTPCSLLVLTSANAVTVIDHPPFEVTESGWGEFEIHMQIYVHDCNEKPIEVSHILKLYPDGDQSQQLNPSKPVVAERYDEIVFNDPSDALRARLETSSIPPSPNGWKSHPNAKWFTVFDMDAEFAQLQQVRAGSLAARAWPTSKLACGRSTKW